MKFCPRCRLVLPIEAFGPDHARGNGQSYCRVCIREYCRLHYNKNKERHNRRRRRNQARYVERNRSLAMGYLTNHPCVDCGESDPCVLDFDHVRDVKASNVSELIGQGWSWRKISIEIEKCEVRCANCHRRKTAVQSGWWQTRYGA